MTFKLVIKNARLITLDPQRPDCFDGWLAVDENGRVADLGEGEAPSDATETVDAAGAFVAPGFVSGHSHLATSGSRGLGQDSALYAWADQMTRYTRHCDAEDI
jgi:cytosine/adenosine deaminase-related metal-dependent hydrolase